MFFQPILELGNYDLAAKGKIECDESVKLFWKIFFQNL